MYSIRYKLNPSALRPYQKSSGAVTSSKFSLDATDLAKSKNIPHNEQWPLGKYKASKSSGVREITSIIFPYPLLWSVSSHRVQAFRPTREGPKVLRITNSRIGSNSVSGMTSATLEDESPVVDMVC